MSLSGHHDHADDCVVTFGCRACITRLTREAQAKAFTEATVRPVTVHWRSGGHTGRVTVMWRWIDGGDLNVLDDWQPEVLGEAIAKHMESKGYKDAWSLSWLWEDLELLDAKPGPIPAVVDSQPSLFGGAA